MEIYQTLKYQLIVTLKEEGKYYAFVTFEDDEVIEMLLSTEIKFKGIKLQISRAKKPKIKTREIEYVDGATKIFVGAIPNNVTKEEFKSYFETYGPIEEMSLPMKNKIKGINKGHGFVTYVYPFSAKLAIENYDKNYLRAKLVS